MAKNPSFARDEVILALSVLYQSGKQRLSERTPEVFELSGLLRRLPLFPQAMRSRDFRMPHGVAQQLADFRSSRAKGKRATNVEELFYIIADEYEGREDELHEVAQAIERSLPAIEEIGLGEAFDYASFPEGWMLGRLHKSIEHRDCAKVKELNPICEICGIDTENIYRQGINLMQLHLMTPLCDLNLKKRYRALDFITVCPNCHEALHRHRPWLVKQKRAELLV